MSACAYHHVIDTKEPGLTVSQIYHQTTHDTTTPLPRYYVKTNAHLSGAQKKIKADNLLPFKPLDNPLVSIYIYPHVALLDDEQIIKPGFTTAFFLYKQNHLALKSEQY